MRSTTTRVWSLLLVLALFVTACGSAPAANDTQTTSDATATPAAVTETDTQTTTQTTADADLLADILARGVLRYVIHRSTRLNTGLSNWACQMRMRM